VVYQNVPIEGHPWAMRAAVDTDCAGYLSPDAYWASVDSIHEHAGEYGGAEHKLALAEQEIDAETLAEGRRFHVEEEKLKVCSQKQDVQQESLVSLCVKIRSYTYSYRLRKRRKV